MKKLYRVEEGKKIGGVCTDLGEYFEIDPVFFRVVFVLLFLFSGVGLLAYLVMWVIVPLKNGETNDAKNARRLCLSDTDRKIAGVCGGLGDYFNIDPVFFRIIFVVLAFAMGAGVILYLIMWLIMPKPQTKPTEPKTSESIPSSVDQDVQSSDDENKQDQ